MTVARTVKRCAQRRLHPDTTGDEVLQSALALLGCVRQRLEQSLGLSASLQDEVVHLTRVDMKRLQSLWYMVRPGVAGETHDELQHLTCQVSAVLSGQRDHVVMLDTLASLVAKLPRREQKLFGDNPGQSLQLSARDTLQVTHARQPLQLLQEQVLEVEWGCVRRQHLEQGLRRAGKRSQKLGQCALQFGDQEALHHWRKWCKVWLYQLYWLVPDARWGWVETLKLMGSVLGRIHDLDVLKLLLAGRVEFADTQLWPVWCSQREQALVQVREYSSRIYAKSAEARSCKAYRVWLKY